MISIFTRVFKPVHDTNGQAVLPVWEIRQQLLSLLFLWQTQNPGLRKTTANG